jgi:site-specific recombinase XerD
MPLAADPQTALVPTVTDVGTLTLVAAEVVERETAAAVAFALADKADATRRAYRSDFQRFDAWCIARGVTAIPAEPHVVAAFLASEAEAGTKPSTLARRVAAIRYAHRLDGHEPPTSAEAVRATLRGIRRTKGTAPAQKTPATADRITDMLKTVPTDTLRGLRDRALLLLGFSGAFRRSELVGLNVEDLAFLPDGVRVMIRHSKGDQEGQGQEIAIPNGAKLQPVEALRVWLEAAGIISGPVFRRIRKNNLIGTDALTAEVVALVVKQYAEKAGFRPEELAGHSLRSGFLTSGAEAGASVFKLMEVSRHKSMDTLRGYVRRAELLKDHAGETFL